MAGDPVNTFVSTLPDRSVMMLKGGPGLLEGGQVLLHRFSVSFQLIEIESYVLETLLDRAFGRWRRILLEESLRTNTPDG